MPGDVAVSSPLPSTADQPKVWTFGLYGRFAAIANGSAVGLGFLLLYMLVQDSRKELEIGRDMMRKDRQTLLVQANADREMYHESLVQMHDDHAKDREISREMQNTMLETSKLIRDVCTDLKATTAEMRSTAAEMKLVIKQLVPPSPDKKKSDIP